MKELLQFVKKIADMKLCEDDKGECYMDSGPYCGAHMPQGWMEEDVKEARKLVRQCVLSINSTTNAVAHREHAESTIREFASDGQLDLMEEFGQVLFQTYGANGSLLAGYVAFLKHKGTEWPENLPLKSAPNIYAAVFPPGFFKDFRPRPEVVAILERAMEASHV